MAQRFWQLSERDIATARPLVMPGTAYAAANFAHQATKKALKAACWHVRAEEPPWRHELLGTARLVAERTGDLPAQVAAAIAFLDPLLPPASIHLRTKTNRYPPN